MTEAGKVGVKTAIKTSSSGCLVSIQSLFCFLSIASISLFLCFQTATSAQLDKQQQRRQHNDLLTIVKSDYMSPNLSQPIAATAVAASATTSASTSGKDTKTIGLSMDGVSHSKLPEFAVIEEEYDDINNTTLIIDYNQRDYNLPSTSKQVASDTEVAAVAAAAAVVPKDQRQRQDEAELVKSITTLEPAVEPIDGGAIETIGQAGGPQAAKLIGQPSISSGDTLIVTDHANHDVAAHDERQQYGSLRASQDAVVRDLRNARPDRISITNKTNIYQILLKKAPFAKYWTAEQKWADLFKRFLAVKDHVQEIMTKNMFKDVGSFATLPISESCANDLKYMQFYQKQSRNSRWLMNMLDAVGKSEAGALTGNLAALGHPVQCVKVRMPARPTNETFDERYFEKQTEELGERFRGKYCLASIRPVMPPKPELISRFSDIMDDALLSNISYFGESSLSIKRRLKQMLVPKSDQDSVDREHYRLDQIPFESELYQYLISQRNFMYSLPRMLGICYPSSCNRQDIQSSLQKSMDDQHQVVDLEFECEQDEASAWDFFTMPRLFVYVFLSVVALVSFGASLARHILVDRMKIEEQLLPVDDRMASLIRFLNIISMDKCAGILFVKTKRASPMVDWSKLENNRSTSIDALKGFLMLALVYSQLVYLGCLPLPFMWAKWNDVMFPFFRSFITQFPLNASIWSEAFYMIGAYLIGTKLLENYRFREGPHFGSYLIKRYTRLVLPMVAFMGLNYVWPRLSNGFVLQDQSNKMLAPCDNHGWTNVLLFHNYNKMNETCLWPSHVSASFFQLHLISYPILLLLLYSLRAQTGAKSLVLRAHKTTQMAISYLGLGLIVILSIYGLVYPAYLASQQELIVPFLIDYIDFDNYRQVIEWTVMPTYNHLTSYMFGLALAYLVVKKRVREETIRSNCSSRAEEEEDFAYLHNKGSFESVMSSSTQELHLRPTNFKLEVAFADVDKLSDRSKQQQQQQHVAASIDHQHKQASGPIGVDGGRRGLYTATSSEGGSNSAYSTCQLLASGLVILAGLSTLAVSWFWNGLSQPMNPSQTFWYMFGTKLVFNLAFAYIFYKYFATRRNSSNPWIITRFLVPIGRMSLTLFYVSWLVIWFDLLTSLYQWHPSHYFVCEKFNEIIAMALIISLFVYGAFEGTIKIVQYKWRADRLRQQNNLEAALKHKQAVAAASAADGSSSHEHEHQRGFDNFFIPLDDYYYDGIGDNGQRKQVESEPFGKFTPSEFNRQKQPLQQQQQQQQGSTGAKLSYNSAGSDPEAATTTTTSSRRQADNKLESHAAGATIDGKEQEQASGAGGRHLSISDQYKLNAELRANYSFASIGLYESAGASADLSHPSDPQMSPSPSDRNH